MKLEAATGKRVEKYWGRKGDATEKAHPKGHETELRQTCHMNH